MRTAFSAILPLCEQQPKKYATNIIECLCHFTYVQCRPIKVPDLKCPSVECSGLAKGVFTLSNNVTSSCNKVLTSVLNRKQKYLLLGL